MFSVFVEFVPFKSTLLGERHMQWLFQWHLNQFNSQNRGVSIDKVILISQIAPNTWLCKNAHTTSSDKSHVFSFCFQRLYAFLVSKVQTRDISVINSILHSLSAKILRAKYLSLNVNFAQLRTASEQLNSKFAFQQPFQ